MRLVPGCVPAFLMCVSHEILSCLSAYLPLSTGAARVHISWIKYICAKVEVCINAC